MTSLNIFGKENFASATEVFKKAIAIEIGEALTAPTTVQTLEGPVEAAIGDRIATGIKGEKYPLPQSAFAQYEAVPGKPGFFVKKKVIVHALPIPTAGTVVTPWGATLNANVGDMLIMETPDNMWVVERSIFADTYDYVEVTTLS